MKFFLIYEAEGTTATSAQRAKRHLVAVLRKSSLTDMMLGEGEKSEKRAARKDALKEIAGLNFRA